MSSKLGTAPVHSRYSPQLAKKFTRNRYKTFKSSIARQVTLLQADVRFRKKCLSYYERGLPDWVILGGMMNLMINLLGKNSGIVPSNPAAAKRLMAMQERLPETVLPVEEFLGDELDMFINIFNLSCLKTYGFTPRRPDLNPEVVEKFLRERMRHFDFDFGHAPLFGEPPGEWPAL